MGILLVSAVLCLGACSRHEEPLNEEASATVLARVDDETLLVDDFLLELPEHLREGLTAEEKAQFINRWIDEQLLFQAAIDMKIDRDPEQNRQLEKMRREYLSGQALHALIEDKTRVTEEELKRYFEEHRGEYQKEVRVRHILVHTREEAEEIRDDLVKKKTSFSTMAKRRSVDPIAGKGGDLGYLSKGNMIPAFESIVFKMNRGEISEVVKSDLGYHLVQLVDIRDARVRLDYEDVRTEILNRLLFEKRNVNYAAIMDSLRESARIDIDLDALRPLPQSGESKPDVATRREGKN